MKKNEKYIGVCESYTYDGMGVVKVDGFPFFIRNVIKGEQVQFIATLVKKTYGFGKVVAILEESSERVQPKCPLFPQCGGCQIQHMSAKEQARFKEEQVESLMRRIAKIDTEVQPIKGMNDPWKYRNKAQIPVDYEGVCGFYRVNSNTIIPMNECLIQSDEMNALYRSVRTWIQTYELGEMMRHILIKEAKDALMLVLITNTKDVPYLSELQRVIDEHHPKVKSIYLNINKRNDNVILGESEILIGKEPTITDTLHHFDFTISPKSFYQVNPIQTEVLYQSALDLCELTNEETVLDLYCGVGTISMFLAQKAKKVIGIEIVPAAIEDAKQNAIRNKIDNVEFVCADAGTFASEFAKSNQNVDVIVVDPPRKGCDQTTVDAIALMSPKKVVYVSCDPSTLARDIERFKAHGYACTYVQPVDMFPQTYHVETVVLMTRK